MAEILTLQPTFQPLGCHDPLEQADKIRLRCLSLKALATAPTELRNTPVVDADKHFSTQRFEKELGVLKTKLTNGSRWLKQWKIGMPYDAIHDWSPYDGAVEHKQAVPERHRFLHRRAGRGLGRG